MCHLRRRNSLRNKLSPLSRVPLRTRDAVRRKCSLTVWSAFISVRTAKYEIMVLATCIAMHRCTESQKLDNLKEA